MRATLTIVAFALALTPRSTWSPRVSPAAPADADGDGYPDAAELRSLEDRRAFLGWFALIAEAQASAPDPRWMPEQRDCAGLVRFAYRQALARHDSAWLARAPYLPGFAPDVSRFQLGHVPLLGDDLFRVGPDTFAPSATAERLVLGSARPLREGERPERGDVLLFRSTADDVAHVMVYLGGGRVAYHTGPRGPDDPGEVRRASTDELARHPDPRWRPIAANPVFAGYYRWRIVGEGGRW